MRALIQRVSSANVQIDSTTVGKIRAGLVVFLGVMHGDTEREAQQLFDKITQLRIFSDADGKMNHSLLDMQGELLVVSQFTLAADCRKGRRPHFTGAASPDEAESLYNHFIEYSRGAGITTQSGQFAANMQVELVNDGPVTIWLDTATR